MGSNEIETWIEESAKYFENDSEKVNFLISVRLLLAYLGLSGIDNPREWVEVTKEERVEAHVSFWKEKAENNQWRCNQLQSEITKLKSELKQAKSEAWDEGYKSGYSDGVTFDIEFTDEDKATNPYKEETKPDFNQNTKLERFGELEDEFKVE